MLILATKVLFEQQQKEKYLAKLLLVDQRNLYICRPFKRRYHSSVGRATD
tara:strand:+ start:432 stop:581 length:150 start_codon:yes stop_codon:yes gene_type:complete